MKYLLLIVSVFFVLDMSAQTGQGYLAFNFVDSLNQPVNPADLEFVVSMAPEAGGTKIIYPVKIQYDAASHLFFLSLDEKAQTAVFYLTVKNKLPPQKTEMLINLHVKFKSASEFQNLLISNIPLDHPKLIIDMPAEKISWQYVPETVKNLNGIDIDFMDITFMQNWWNQ